MYFCKKGMMVQNGVLGRVDSSMKNGTGKVLEAVEIDQGDEGLNCDSKKEDGMVSREIKENPQA